MIDRRDCKSEEVNKDSENISSKSMKKSGNIFSKKSIKFPDKYIPFKIETEEIFDTSISNIIEISNNPLSSRKNTINKLLDDSYKIGKMNLEIFNRNNLYNDSKQSYCSTNLLKTNTIKSILTEKNFMIENKKKDIINNILKKNSTSKKSDVFKFKKYCFFPGKINSYSPNNFRPNALLTTRNDNTRPLFIKKFLSIGKINNQVRHILPKKNFDSYKKIDINLHNNIQGKFDYNINNVSVVSSSLNSIKLLSALNVNVKHKRNLNINVNYLNNAHTTNNKKSYLNKINLNLNNDSNHQKNNDLKTNRFTSNLKISQLKMPYTERNSSNRYNLDKKDLIENNYDKKSYREIKINNEKGEKNVMKFLKITNEKNKLLFKKPHPVKLKIDPNKINKINLNSENIRQSKMEKISNMVGKPGFKGLKINNFPKIYELKDINNTDPNSSKRDSRRNFKAF